MLTNKTIILGVTGSVAAYKAVELASKLTRYFGRKAAVSAKRDTVSLLGKFIVSGNVAGCGRALSILTGRSSSNHFCQPPLSTLTLE